MRCLRRDVCQPGLYPSKMFGYTADVAMQVPGAPQFGLWATLHGVDWPAIRDRIFARVDEISRQDQGRSASANVTVYEGHARFAGPREFVINDQTRIAAEQIVIATGGRPSIPQWWRSPALEFYTSDTVLRLDVSPGEHGHSRWWLRRRRDGARVFQPGGRYRHGGDGRLVVGGARCGDFEAFHRTSLGSVGRPSRCNGRRSRPRSRRRRGGP